LLLVVLDGMMLILLIHRIHFMVHLDSQPMALLHLVSGMDSKVASLR
jgi:hypothetical protein